ncbi:ATP synthase subunit 5, mitochondrial [Smittium culicis]|uniref:ATP synthase subunit 5, mitochondrial n=1 Tax=Smittium culicis TaxID=133412 RepID=A0A1R1X056_9FUNG|nr:ATP synthase subunit 5, mitochondrial [Smittium culicis]OMJ19845.1 ATP synthase subunit 5, mitochondrial [Smittium culicis]OMJ23391.1 ATP synthase subunit 5, mitochondrial [Smittium culicis]
MFRATKSASKIISRSYATANVKAPLALHGIEGRYATALFQAAVAKNQLDKVETDLTKLSQQMSKNAKLNEVLSSPLAGKVVKEKVLNSFPGLSETTSNFFNLLAENNRVNMIHEIIAEYSNLMKAHKGIVPVKVTTAAPLDNKSLNQIKDIVGSRNLVKNFKQLEIVNTVNPSIIGGMVVEFGDFTVDMSVSSKIAKLDKLLTDSISI